MMSAIEACSKALLKLGENPIQSFDEGTVEAEVAEAVYGSSRDALLSAHPWSFASGQSSLPKLVATPVADSANAYHLPEGFLRAISLGGSIDVGRGASYRIHEKRVHTTVDPAILTYIFRADESATPPFFDQVLVAVLAFEMCVPLTESNTRAQALSKSAEGELRRARLIDSQQQTPGHFEDFTLINARSS